MGYRSCFSTGTPLYIGNHECVQRSHARLSIHQVSDTESNPNQLTREEIPRLDCSIVMVGLMGAGKTAVGRRLAAAMDVAFTDADEEIEAAAGMSIPDIFETYGEEEFRDLERRIVARLLDEPPGVLALGGGAFVDSETRGLVRSMALSIWLRAELDILVARTARRPGKRPLLSSGDPKAILAKLMREREPAYSEADIVVDSGIKPAETVVEKILRKLAERSKGNAA